MNALDRYNKFCDYNLDAIILDIKYGKIKCGKKAGLVKINPKENVKLNGRLLGKER